MVRCRRTQFPSTHVSCVFSLDPSFLSSKLSRATHLVQCLAGSHPSCGVCGCHPRHHAPPSLCFLRSSPAPVGPTVCLSTPIGIIIKRSAILAHASLVRLPSGAVQLTEALKCNRLDKQRISSKGGGRSSVLLYVINLS